MPVRGYQNKGAGNATKAAGEALPELPLEDGVMRWDAESLGTLSRRARSGKFPQDAALQQTLFKTLDILGVRSQVAQGISAPLTSVNKMYNNPDFRVYLLIKDHKGVGILKVGTKNLFVSHPAAKTLVEIHPTCVLDFYVAEEQQRQGLGKVLYSNMLKAEHTQPELLAIDRPSPKFLGFMHKHYNLYQYTPEVNNFVVYHRYFDGTTLTERGQLRRVHNPSPAAATAPPPQPQQQPVARETPPGGQNSAPLRPPSQQGRRPTNGIPTTAAYFNKNSGINSNNANNNDEQYTVHYLNDNPGDAPLDRQPEQSSPDPRPPLPDLSSSPTEPKEEIDDVMQKQRDALAAEEAQLAELDAKIEFYKSKLASSRSSRSGEETRKRTEDKEEGGDDDDILKGMTRAMTAEERSAAGTSREGGDGVMNDDNLFDPKEEAGDEQGTNARAARDFLFAEAEAKEKMQASQERSGRHPPGISLNNLPQENKQEKENENEGEDHMHSHYADAQEDENRLVRSQPGQLKSALKSKPAPPRKALVQDDYLDVVAPIPLTTREELHGLHNGYFPPRNPSPLDEGNILLGGSGNKQRSRERGTRLPPPAPVPVPAPVLPPAGEAYYYESPAYVEVEGGGSGGGGHIYNIEEEPPLALPPPHPVPSTGFAREKYVYNNNKNNAINEFYYDHDAAAAAGYPLPRVIPKVQMESDYPGAFDPPLPTPTAEEMNGLYNGYSYPPGLSEEAGHSRLPVVEEVVDEGNILLGGTGNKQQARERGTRLPSRAADAYEEGVGSAEGRGPSTEDLVASYNRLEELKQGVEERSRSRPSEQPDDQRTTLNPLLDDEDFRTVVSAKRRREEEEEQAKNRLIVPEIKMEGKQKSAAATSSKKKGTTGTAGKGKRATVRPPASSSSSSSAGGRAAGLPMQFMTHDPAPTSISSSTAAFNYNDQYLQNATNTASGRTGTRKEVGMVGGGLTWGEEDKQTTQQHEGTVGMLPAREKQEDTTKGALVTTAPPATKPLVLPSPFPQLQQQQQTTYPFRTPDGTLRYSDLLHEQSQRYQHGPLMQYRDPDYLAAARTDLDPIARPLQYGTHAAWRGGQTSPAAYNSLAPFVPPLSTNPASRLLLEESRREKRKARRAMWNEVLLGPSRPAVVPFAERHGLRRYRVGEGPRPVGIPLLAPTAPPLPQQQQLVSDVDYHFTNNEQVQLYAPSNALLGRCGSEYDRLLGMPVRRRDPLPLPSYQHLLPRSTPLLFPPPQQQQQQQSRHQVQYQSYSYTAPSPSLQYPASSPIGSSVAYNILS